MMKRRQFTTLGAGMLGALMQAGAFARSGFPERLITLVIPYGPGGALEAIIRPVTEAVSKTMPERMIIDFKPGADGRIGTANVSRSAPDGYTLISASPGLAVAEHLWPESGLKAKDFVGICGIAAPPSVYVVHSSLPIHSMQEFIAHTRSRPGEVAVPHPGIGSGVHLAQELFFREVGISVNSIPYKGTGPSITDLLAGRLHFGLAYQSVILPHIKSGRVRPLAMNAEHRTRSLPDVPTLGELGYGNAVSQAWGGVAASAKTPPHIIEYLSAEFQKAMGLPEVRSYLQNLDLEILGTNAQAFTAMIYRESDRLAKLVRDRGIKA